MFTTYTMYYSHVDLDIYFCIKNTDLHKPTYKLTLHMMRLHFARILFFITEHTGTWPVSGILTFKITHLVGSGWIEPTALLHSFTIKCEVQPNRIFSGLFDYRRMLVCYNYLILFDTTF